MIANLLFSCLLGSESCVQELYVNVKIIMKGSEMYMDGNCKVFLLRFNRGLQVIHESRIIVSNWLRYKFCVG